MYYLLITFLTNVVDFYLYIVCNMLRPTMFVRLLDVDTYYTIIICVLWSHYIIYISRVECYMVV